MKIAFTNYLCRKRWHLLVAILMAMLAIIVDYWTMNWSVTLGTEKAKIQLLEYVRRQLCGASFSHASDSILMVDVHYDKVMLTERKQFSDGTCLELGQVPVTDRSKLLKLLKYLKANNKYRYVILDVRLESSTQQQEDSVLWQTIADMPRIVIARSKDMQLASPLLEKKAAAAQYETALWESDFVKYPFYVDTIPSMALKMYRDITNRNISNNGLLWLDEGDIARRSMILTWDFSDYQERFYLGDYVEDLSEGDDEQWSGSPTGKYVLIGDFEDDIHPTFLGEIPGTLLIFNAFSSLMHRRHILSLCLVLFLFCIFFALSWLTLSRNTRFDWLCSFLGYTGILFIVNIFTYLVFNEVYDILITALLFTALKTIMRLYDKRHKVGLISQIINHIKK